jgi:hypothetical protein
MWRWWIRRFAEHYFGTRSPVGRHLGYFGQVPGAIRIVGEVQHLLFSGPCGNSELRQIVAKLDRTAPVYEMKTLDFSSMKR